MRTQATLSSYIAYCFVAFSPWLFANGLANCFVGKLNNRAFSYYSVSSTKVMLNNSLVVWHKRDTALIHRVETRPNLMLITLNARNFSATPSLSSLNKNNLRVIFSKETLFKHFTKKNLYFGVGGIIIITLIRLSGLPGFILLFLFDSSAEGAKLALSSTLALPFRLVVKGIIDGLLDVWDDDANKMTMGGDLPDNKPPYKQIDPKKSPVSTMNDNQEVTTNNNPGQSSGGGSTLKKGSGTTYTEGDVSVNINIMPPYQLAQGVKKYGWDYLLNILGNSLSSGKVTERVDICFTIKNSNGDKYLMGMRYDLRTLPLNHSLHPDNNSPIFSLIDKTNARTITKHIISIDDTTENFVPHL